MCVWVRAVEFRCCSIWSEEGRCSRVGDRLTSLLLIRRSPGSTLFPYTTLFRSLCGRSSLAGTRYEPSKSSGVLLEQRECRRSEEHTSELQSLTKLVCRLLLEKKTESRRHACYRPPPTRTHRTAHGTATPA